MSEKTDKEAVLSKRLGLWPTTLAGVGAILGAGIYVLIGITAGQAGNAVWLSFLLAATGASLTGFSYARLIQLRPGDAPEFHYVSMAFGPRLGFLAGWLALWVIIASVAVVSLGFAGYMFHLLGLPIPGSAIGLVLFSMLVLFLGVGESILMMGLFTVIEVIGLVIIIGIGVPYIGQLDYLEMPHGIAGVTGAASLAFFIYLGFQDMVNFAEEMKDPVRDLPRAIILALTICTALYILVALSALSVLGWESLSQSPAPLAEVAAKVLGARADLALTLIALVATANTVLIMLFAASRAIWAISCAGALPEMFCLVGERRRTPWKAILVAGVLAIGFALTRNIEGTAQFANFGILVAFSLVNASAIRLFSLQARTGPRGMMGLALHGAGVAVCLWLAARTGWLPALLGGGLLLAGVLAYWLRGVMSRKTRGE